MSFMPGPGPALGTWHRRAIGVTARLALHGMAP
jgi:hypothetical protein